MAQTGQASPTVQIVGFDGTDYHRVSVDSEGNFATRNLIWNTSSLAWERATGSLAGGATVTVNNFPATYPATDNGGSLTVDAPVGTPAFVRLSDGSAAITTLPVSLASLPALATGTNAIGTVQPGNTANTTAWLVLEPFSTRSDTYTATGSGTIVDVTASPMQYFAVQVKSTGGEAITWDVRLDGSLDGTNFTQIIAHTNTDGDGLTKWLATLAPSLYFRSRTAGLVLGGATNIVVTILGRG